MILDNLTKLHRQVAHFFEQQFPAYMVTHVSCKGETDFAETLASQKKRGIPPLSPEELTKVNPYVKPKMVPLCTTLTFEVTAVHKRERVTLSCTVLVGSDQSFILENPRIV